MPSPSTTRDCVSVYTMLAGEKGGEDWLRAVSFAAGTAAFMACIERAVMVSVFVHWRVWAFLALNLLLLAILFTSKTKNQTPLIQTHNKTNSEAELKGSKKIRISQQLASSGGGPEEAVPVPPPEAEMERDEKVEDYDELSEEELKQRVEDFIAMFRQHLICDAKKGMNVMGCAAANIITSPVY